MDPLTQVREQIATRLTARAGLVDQLHSLRAELTAGGTVTESDIDAIVEKRDALDAEIEALQAREAALADEARRDEAAAALARQYAPAASVTIGREEAPYRERGSEHSFLRDLVLARHRGDADALDRLRRNNAHVTHERALSTTDGAGGEFVPPLWLLEKYEKLARPGRVFADSVNKLPLPAGTDSISIPVITGGTSVGQQTINNALSNTDMTTSSATAAVSTIGGRQIVPLQLIEQSPVSIESIIFDDLTRAHAAQIDTYCLTSNAAGKRGVLNASGINAVTYTDGSATVPELWPKLVDAKRKVHEGRKLPAERAFMHPNRWAWLEAALDTNNRPYVSDMAAAAIPLLAGQDGIAAEGYAGVIRGLNIPVYLDPNIPVNLGAGTNEDRIIVARPSDAVLFESPLKAEASVQEAFSNLQVVFRLYSYAAFTAEHAPKAFSVIAGTGLSAPVF